jgi:hypothetical protein
MWITFPLITLCETLAVFAKQMSLGSETRGRFYAFLECQEPSSSKSPPSSMEATSHTSSAMALQRR